MLLVPDCIPCIRTMALRTIGATAARKRSVRESIASVTDIPADDEGQWHITAPEVISKVWEVITSYTGSPDPLASAKDRQNREMLQLLPSVTALLQDGSDVFEETVAFVVMANNIDAMTGLKASAGPGPGRAHRGPLFTKGVAGLRERLRSARSLVYLGDNCGEIMADKLLISFIRTAYDVKVFFVVRSLPVLNDATLDDARLAGMEEVAHVMENGIERPFPGTSLSLASPELRDLIGSADLIISKGGGNYDVLSEERSLGGRISYLLPAKCRPYAALHRVRRKSLLLLNA